MLAEIRIDNRINGFLGRPSGRDKRPAVIHLHERYGIVQHTTDLAQKLVDAGYVTVVPDLFSRFTGDGKRWRVVTVVWSCAMRRCCKTWTPSWPICARYRRWTAVGSP